MVTMVLYNDDILLTWNNKDKSNWVNYFYQVLPNQIFLHWFFVSSFLLLLALLMLLLQLTAGQYPGFFLLIYGLPKTQTIFIKTLWSGLVCIFECVNICFIISESFCPRLNIGNWNVAHPFTDAKFNHSFTNDWILCCA